MKHKKSTNIEQLKEELKPKVDIIKTANILFDGRQFMVKLPQEISRFYNIKKGDKFKFDVKPIKKGEDCSRKS